MSNEAIYKLSREQCQRISRALEIIERDTGRSSYNGIALRNEMRETYIGKTTSDITGLYYETEEEIEYAYAGSGTIEFYKLLPYETAGPELNPTTITETAYNLTEDVIPTDTWVTLVRDPYSGKLFATQGGGGGSDMIEGELAEALTAHGDALLATYDETGELTGDTVLVEDKAGFAASSGQYCMAARIGSGYTYRPIVIGCPA